MGEAGAGVTARPNRRAVSVRRRAPSPIMSVMTEDVFRAVAEALKHGEPVALVTIVFRRRTASQRKSNAWTITFRMPRVAICGGIGT